ncbi:MAG TPA: hypothetical protein VLV78_20890 [Thermoanaerobaculia bacterium]|nr:hypothetical protein [Thermoanaerobaculia bacterium]
MVRMVLVYPLKIGALALIFWFLVRQRLPQTPAIVVAIVLAILFHIAIAAWLTSRRRLADARLLQNTLRGEVPRDGQRIALAGTIEPEGETLRTPFGVVPCVLYSYEIYRMVQSRSSSSSSTSTTTRVTDFSGVALAPSVIRTSNGRFAICGFPYLTDPVRESGREPARLANARDYIARSEFARTIPFAGELAALDHAMMTTARSLRFDWQMTDGDRIGEATLQEEYVPPSTRMCALGVYSAADKGLVPGRGAEERIRLIAGEGPDVLQGLTGGARYSQVLTAVMVLIVAGALSYILLR